LVLAAAFLHASWNASLRGRPTDCRLLHHRGRGGPDRLARLTPDAKQKRP
jgi:hypothetical protein